MACLHMVKSGADGYDGWKISFWADGPELLQDHGLERRVLRGHGRKQVGTTIHKIMAA